MNIKTSNSATKNKLFLGFWFVLFASLILLINWLLYIPVNRADQLMNRIADVEMQITRLTALHSEYLVTNDKEDNLFSGISGNIELEAKLVTASINEHINSIKSVNSIAKKETISSSLDELSGIISSYEANLNNLILITHERGNQSSGLVNNWLEISQRMLNVAAEARNADAERLHRIKLLEAEYLLNRNPKILQDISISAEEIRNEITMEEGSISIHDMDSYMVLTGHLLSIEKRMGHTDIQGIIPDLENALQQLPQVFNTCRELIQKQVKRSHVIWTSLRILAIALIISLFVYLFVNVFSLIDPLRQIAGFTRRMANGEFPEDKIAAGKLIDMHVISESLGKHIASLREKYGFIRAMNNDKLDSTLNLSSYNDILGKELVLLQKKILETNEKQAKNDEDNHVRRYMNEGLAKFADILRSKNNDIHMLGDSFIREIVKYLNAIQGGFFIFDDSDPSDPVLRLISAFAYNRKKFLDQTVKYGEGLVGSCARERQYINLTDIPPGYISITSGLGDTPPGNLLLIPVLHENELLGVIEMASMHEYKEHEIEFARDVALSLGSTLVNTRNNQRTSELLGKSQQQALEMAEQEEEMRQNMEELKATQEESNRREEEFRGIAEAIGDSLFVTEYNLDGKIRHVNEKLCVFLGKDREDLIGKTHAEVFESSLKTDAAFWKELQRNGQYVTTETIRVGKKSFELLEHFTPVTDRNKNTVKFINFATNGRIGNS
jgi:PAS domain S-box-containing protein